MIENGKCYGVCYIYIQRKKYLPYVDLAKLF